MSTPFSTRLAPSPTGPLHLGNARTFVLSWALARSSGWKILLRHEDLDAQRATLQHCQAIEETLRWLGLDWDAPATKQSTSLEPFRHAMKTLEEQGLIYPCALSRNEISLATNAPHSGDKSRAFPASLRAPLDSWHFKDETTNYRFAVEPGTTIVQDMLAGEHTFDVAEDCGDFVVWTKAAVPAYQLAVVVDDFNHGITDVVRGDDLLPSSARQQLLAHALGQPSPRWWHVPLVFGEDSKRLAKRNGGADIATYRKQGVPPERILGLLAWWSGLQEQRQPLSAPSIIDLVSEESMRSLVDTEVTRECPRLFSKEDHAWLLSSDS